MKKIVFLTGTRADYGKLKSLMSKVHNSKNFEFYLFVTGMHMLSRYGSTWREIEKDGFVNVYHFINQTQNTLMDIALSNTISGISNYVAEIQPDAIVVHGDRLEALAGAIVGAFNNIKVIHIEGGEVSGTIDESIRHSITKLAHIHMVSNEESKKRIVQMGEDERSIFVIGSPDIDIMHSKNLPSIKKVKKHYNIPYNHYAIAIYHPVTTEIDKLKENIKVFVQALVESELNYIVIFPNNDLGSDEIIREYNQLIDKDNFKVFPSIRFEYFLTLLKYAKFMIGNSSAGVREASIYGIPSIDVGNRQKGRYIISDLYIQHVQEVKSEIINKISNIPKYKGYSYNIFGDGKSDERFIAILEDEEIWNIDVQKQFFDIF